jgi:pseudouridine synthase
MEKINAIRLISQKSGYSRRHCEDLLKKGLITINGSPVQVNKKYSPNDIVEINGKSFSKKEKNIYIKLNKPENYVCTSKKFKEEKSIYSLIKIKERLFSVGRLDKNSSGLIILTNDGDLTYKLTHPKFNHKKTYQVTIRPDKKLADEKFIKIIERKFLSGIDINEKTLAKAKKIRKIKENKFEIILSEGKKRQIRKMFEHFDLAVSKLKRTEFAGIKLEELKSGDYKDLSKEELLKIKKSL